MHRPAGLWVRLLPAWEACLLLPSVCAKMGQPFESIELVVPKLGPKWEGAIGAQHMSSSLPLRMPECGKATECGNVGQGNGV